MLIELLEEPFYQASAVLCDGRERAEEVVESMLCAMVAPLLESRKGYEPREVWSGAHRRESDGAPVYTRVVAVALPRFEAAGPGDFVYPGVAGAVTARLPATEHRRRDGEDGDAVEYLTPSLLRRQYTFVRPDGGETLTLSLFQRAV